MNIVKAKKTELRSGLATDGTSIALRDFVDSNGNQLALSDFGSFLVVVVKQGDQTEIIRCNGVTQNTDGTANLAIESSYRDMPAKPPYTTGSATGKAFQTGAEVIVSNDPYTMSFMLQTNNNDPQTVLGDIRFPAPTVGANAATKDYADGLAVAGAPKAETTVRGISMLAESPNVTLGTVTVTIASPGVFTLTSHNLQEGDTIQLTTTGSLPTGLTVSTDYYVISAGLTANNFQVSATLGGAAINTSGSQSGTHTLLRTTPYVLTTENTEIPTANEKQFLGAVTGMISMYGGSSAPTGFLLCNGQAVSRTTYADLFAVVSTSYGVGDGSTTFNVPDLRSSFPIGLGQKTKAFTFVDGDVTVGNDQIVVDDNDYLYTGQAVVLSTTGTLPTGLSAGTYYIIRVNSTTVRLATSRANADDGVDVDITAASGGGTHTMTLTLTDRTIGDEGGEESHTLQTEEIPSHTHDNAYAYLPDNNNVAGGSGSGDANTTIGITGGDSPHNNVPPYVTVNFIIKT